MTETNAIALPTFCRALVLRSAILPINQAAFMSQQPNLADGCRVELRGIISRPEIKRCRGIVIGEFHAEKQRWPVLVATRGGKDEEMLLRSANLVLLSDTDSEESDASDESASSTSSDEKFFKCEYKISQNMEQRYRSLSGAPLMSFLARTACFRKILRPSTAFVTQLHAPYEWVFPQSSWCKHSKAPSCDHASSVATHGIAAKTVKHVIG
jgi:hypothetical protein